MKSRLFLSLTRWSKFYSQSRTFHEIRELSQEFCNFLRIDNFSFIVTMPSDTAIIRRIMLCSFVGTPGPLKGRASVGFAFHEAVFQTSLLNRTPVIWSTDLEHDMPVPASWLHLDALDTTLLTDGISFGFHNGHGLKSVLSFAVQNGTMAQRDVHYIVPHIYAIAPYLNQSFDRAYEDAAQKWKISNRERECLKWLVQGKTLWEIGAILALSERTVRFHIDRIVNKLSCANRTQAIAKAIYYGLVDIMDVFQTSDTVRFFDGGRFENR